MNTKDLRRGDVVAFNGRHLTSFQDDWQVTDLPVDDDLIRVEDPQGNSEWIRPEYIIGVLPRG